GAGGLQRRAWHAARHRHVDVQWYLVGGGEQPAHAALTRDVGDFVRVANDAGDATRQNQARVVPRCYQRRLKMQMTIYESGGQIGAVEFDDLLGFGFEFGTDRGNEAPG